MKNKKQEDIFNKAIEHLKSTGRINYDALIKEFGLEPELAPDGVHMRIMLDGTFLFINPLDDDLWEEVDQAISLFKKTKKQSNL